MPHPEHTGRDRRFFSVCMDLCVTLCLTRPAHSSGAFPLYMGGLAPGRRVPPTTLPASAGHKKGANSTMESTKTVRLIYVLDETGRKASILAGSDGGSYKAVEAPVTAELLGWTSVDARGSIMPIRVEAVRAAVVEGGRSTPRVETRYLPAVEFDAPQTADQLIAWLRTEMREREDSRAVAEAALPSALEAWETRVGAVKAEEARWVEAQKRREAEATAARRQRAQEKRAWIAEHGSDYLRHAHVDLGYDCHRRYVIERVALELPGYTVDYDDRAAWKDRWEPSPKALAEVDRLRAMGHDAVVVWLTGSPEGEEYPEYDEREAVVVRDYRQAFTLIRTADLG